MEKIIEHLNRFPLESVPEPERRLPYLALSSMEISFAVEVFGEPDESGMFEELHTFPVWRCEAQQERTTVGSYMFGIRPPHVILSIRLYFSERFASKHPSFCRAQQAYQRQRSTTRLF